MALSDFYDHKDHVPYVTRIVVHTRDSEGDPEQTMQKALDLLNTVKVNAIIGPEIFMASKLVASISEKARVPVFSFAGKSSAEYPYFFQLTEDERNMAKSIAALVESFKWRDVIYVYEENDDQGEDILQYLFESFQNKNIRLTHRSTISTSATDEEVKDELRKLMTLHTSVFVVNMSPLLASRFFVHAKKLGMMSKEYAWILTQKTIEVTHSTDFKVIESLQGVLGVRTYIPASSNLHDLKQKWHKKFSTEIPMLAIWAYDMIWALAKSVETVRVLENGSTLLSEILKIELKGVSGEFRLNQRKLVSPKFEIINVIDNGERKVGYWTLSDGIRRAHTPFEDTLLHSINRVEDVIWPGGSTTIPRGWILRMSLGNTLRIGIITGVPFKYFVDAYIDAEKNVTIATGFSVDVFNTCIHALPYEVPYEFIPLKYERYGDIIMKVYNKELDGVLGDTTILASRSKCVEFTSAYTGVGLGTLTRIKEKDWRVVLKPLDVSIWLTFVLCSILAIFTIWAIEFMNPEPEIRVSSPRIEKIIWLILLAMFFAQRDKLSKNLSRFVMFVWFGMVLVLIASYTLTSLLTVEQFELATKGGIAGSHGGSFSGGVTINNVKLRDNMEKPYYSYEDYATALAKGGKHGGADAIVDEVPYIQMFVGRHSDDYAMLSSQPITSGFGFVFAKGSPLEREMSTAIANIREDGTLLNLEKKWFEKQSSLSYQDYFKTPKSQNFDRFLGLFIAIGVCLVVALTASAFNVLRARMEVLNIIRLLAGYNLIVIIRYLSFRNSALT